MLEPIEEKDLNLEAKIKGGIAEPSLEAPKPFVVEREAPQEISASEKDSAYNKILSKVQKKIISRQRNCSPVLVIYYFCMELPDQK